MHQCLYCGGFGCGACNSSSTYKIACTCGTIDGCRLHPKIILDPPLASKSYIKYKHVGWECPKCAKVYGPHIDQCINCNK